MFVLSWFCWYLIYILIIKYWLLSLPTIIFGLALVKTNSMHTDTHFCILLTLRINYQLHHRRIIFLVLPGFTIQSQNSQEGKWIKVKIKTHFFLPKKKKNSFTNHPLSVTLFYWIKKKKKNLKTKPKPTSKNQ